MRTGKITAALCLCAMACLPARGLDYVLRVSTPMMLSAGAGFKFGEPTGALRPGIMAEAGIGGGKISVGLDNLGEGGFGYGIKGSFLQTWLEPIDVDEDVSYLGVDGELSINRLILSLGGYRRVSSGDDDWIVSAGLGFSF